MQMLSIQDALNALLYVVYCAVPVVVLILVGILIVLSRIRRQIALLNQQQEQD